MTEIPAFLTVAEFAKKMRWHPNTVRKQIKNGRLQAVRSGEGAGSSYRIPDTEIVRLCEMDTVKIIDRLIDEKIEQKLGERK